MAEETMGMGGVERKAGKVEDDMDIISIRDNSDDSDWNEGDEEY